MLVREKLSKDKGFMKKSTIERNTAIDLLRIISCFHVIVNHTNSNVFMNTEPSLEWLISLSFHYICKSAVPIFLMISGYTMLGKKDSYRKIIKRLVRILVVVVIFSFPYYLKNVLAGDIMNFNPINYLLELWDSPVTMSYWYLYLYAGILVMLPFLQKLADAMDKKDFCIFLSLGLAVSSLWPVLSHHKPVLEYSSCVELPIFSSTICLLLFGAFVNKWDVERKIPRAACILGAGLACAYSVFMTYREYMQTAGTDYLFYDEMSYLPIAAEAVCIFLLVKSIRITGGCARIISTIGRCTFGIYLLSDGLVDCFRKIYFDLCDRGVPRLAAAVVWELAVFTVGLGIVWLYFYFSGLWKKGKERITSPKN